MGSTEKKAHVLSRGGDPEEIAQAAVMMSTNRFMTDSEIRLDGGWLMVSSRLRAVVDCIERFRQRCLKTRRGVSIPGARELRSETSITRTRF